MKRMNGARRGFSLVELLAVVLILAVLAGVAIPLYINSRRQAAARACKGNIASIASAKSAYALRNGAYTTTIANLVGAPEGLAATPTCPLGAGTYTLTDAAGQLTISCTTNTVAHQAAVAGTYTQVMAAPPAAETIP